MEEWDGVTFEGWWSAILKECGIQQKGPLAEPIKVLAEVAWTEGYIAGYERRLTVFMVKGDDNDTEAGSKAV